MPYDNPAGLIAMSVILEVLALASVGLRFLARRKKRAPALTDDWLILAAMIVATGSISIEIRGMIHQRCCCDVKL